MAVKRTQKNFDTYKGHLIDRVTHEIPSPVPDGQAVKFILYVVDKADPPYFSLHNARHAIDHFPRFN